MRIELSTIVSGANQQEVFQRFDHTLFDVLAPAFPPMRVERFDGSEVGDVVHVKLWSPIGWMEWRSNITEREEGSEVSHFVDEGEILPMGLRYWRHKHWVKQRGNDVEIVDDITYEASNKVISILLYPALYMQFYMRKPKYKAFFQSGEV